MKKKLSNLIILGCILLVILGIVFFIYFVYYYNLNIIKGLWGLFITFLFFLLFIILPTTINSNRIKLVNDNFILDIYNKNNDVEHIRITDKNLLFKYKSEIRFAGILPNFFRHLIITKKELYRTPTFIIKNRNQLTTNEMNDIIEEINNLNNNVNGDIIINYNGNKKFSNKNDIDKIFEKYFL